MPGLCRRGHDDHRAAFPDFHMAQPVHDCHAPDFELASGKRADFFEFLQRHRFVRVIFEKTHRLALRIIADDSFEDEDCAILGTPHGVRNLLDVDGLAR